MFKLLFFLLIDGRIPRPMRSRMETYHVMHVPGRGRHEINAERKNLGLFIGDQVHGKNNEEAFLEDLRKSR
jgi:hypothetical protein